MRDIDSLKLILDLDKNNMLTLLLNFPLQCEDAWKRTRKFSAPKDYRNIDKIVFAGLGGSAIGADLIRSYLTNELNKPIVVVRDYSLPKYVDKKTLLFICSYSGNTEETISCYKDGSKKKAKIIVISSDGKLLNSAKKSKIPYVQIPKDMPPRTALGYLSVVPLGVFCRLKLIKDKSLELNRVIKELKVLRDNFLSPYVMCKRNIAKKIAKEIHNKYVFIYGPNLHFDTATIRFRGQLAENSKALASSHVLPEMNHNEIVGWVHPKELFKKFVVIILRDSQEHPQVKKRMQITTDIIEKEGAKVIQIYSRGKGLLARIFSVIYIGDFTSFYLALLYGIDPTPVDRITYLKKRLAS